MDMLKPDSGLDLLDDSWPIFAQTVAAPAAFIGADSNVINSAFNRGDVIDGDVQTSVLSQNVTVENGAVVDHSVLFPGVTVEAGAEVRYAIIGEGCHIAKDCKIGEGPEGCGEWGVTVLGPGCDVEAGRVIKAKRMLDSEGKEVTR